VLADEVGVMACAHDRMVNIFAAMSRWGLRDAYRETGFLQKTPFLASL
jgi:hypothetical protein